MVLIPCQILETILHILLKKYKTLTTISNIHVYVSRINKRLVFKLKDGHKLDLQPPVSIKLLALKIQIVKKSNGENVLSLKKLKYFRFSVV